MAMKPHPFRPAVFLLTLGPALFFHPLPAQTVLVPEKGLLVVEAGRVPKEPEFLYTLEVESTIQPLADTIAQGVKIKAKVRQGKPDAISLALHGEGEVVAVEGNGVAGWATRAEPGAGGKRWLDIRFQPATPGAPLPEVLEVSATLATRIAGVPAEVSPVLPGDAGAAGYSARVILRPGDGVTARVLEADGLMETRGGGDSPVFIATGDPRLRLRLAPPGGEEAVDWADARLDLTLASGGTVFAGEWTGTARVRRAGAEVVFLRGRAVLLDLPSDPSVRARAEGGETRLVFTEARDYPLRLRFAAAVRADGAWNGPDFTLAAAPAFPVVLRGLGGSIEFDPAAPVLPVAAEGVFTAFLPPDGHFNPRWREAGLAKDGKLYLNSTATVDMNVTAAVAKQESILTLRALQGEFRDLDFRLDGPGEILSVQGEDVAAWSVDGTAPDKPRVLKVKFARALRQVPGLRIQSQLPLGGLPASAAPLRIAPATGETRHAGSLRVVSVGATRVEAREPRGLMQLAPDQWPGGAAPANARRILVYRFPIPDYDLPLRVEAMVPELSVSQVLVHEMGETDRVLHADLELEVRDAPIREWEIHVPADHSVASLAGAEVADHVLGGEAGPGLRRLKILFREAVLGRRLISLRLEKNTPASAGAWELPALDFPGVKNARGFVGVAATPGFRPVPGRMDGLAETPPAYFPRQTPGLQHAYRIRGGEWKARFEVAALGQNVQADLFHLHTLREGMAAGSVLVNFFTAGSPSSEWRFEVPESCGNLSIDGEGVRAWRREGTRVLVSLDKPSLGASTLLITFEEPLPARAAVLRPGRIRPAGVQGERGVVQIISPFQVRHSLAGIEGNLLRLEAGELPPALRLLVSSPSLAIFQYNERPFAIEMNIDGFEPAETAESMIDFARLASTVAWDGQIVTEARWFVKSRGRGALRLRLPEGATLWEATAGGASVNARLDGKTTLIPLPGSADTVSPVEVTMRYGQLPASGPKARLIAPVAEVPTGMGEWEISADRGRALVPAGGNVPALGRENSSFPSGLPWRPLVITSSITALLLGLALLAGARRPWLGVVLGLLAIVHALAGAVSAPRAPMTDATDRLHYAAPVVPAGEGMVVEVRNIPSWQARLPWTPLALGFSAMLFLSAARFTRRRRGGLAGWFAPVGWALGGAAVLGLPHGVTWWFVWLALFGVAVLRPMLLRSFRSPTPPLPPVATTLFLLALGAFAANPARAADVASVDQEWLVRDGRVLASVKMTMDAKTGETIQILAGPYTLSAFAGDGARLARASAAADAPYLAVAERDGRTDLSFRYEFRAGDKAGEVDLPTPAAPVAALRVVFERPDWMASSESAIMATPLAGLPAGQSGDSLVLAPTGGRVLLSPRPRDLSIEAPRFFAEVSNLYLPSAGIINGRHRVQIRPTQGEVARLTLRVPEKFTVGEVRSEGLADWKFDPAARGLSLVFAPAKREAFLVEVVTQQPTGDLPYTASLTPLHVEGAAGEVGMTGLAPGGDAQTDTIVPTAMTDMDTGDFDPGLLGRGPSAVLPQKVFRHTGTGASLAARLLPVQAEIKADVRQTLSLGEERLTMAVDIHCTITRAGIFRLSFPVPEGLEVEAASGDTLSHWTETGAGKDRVVTLHLNGRTLGEAKFAITLGGPFPGARESWDVPRFLVNEATRQIGRLSLVPDRGIRARPLSRQHVTQEAGPDAQPGRPGALSFRLLQGDWKLSLAIEKLEPWVTSRLLQEVSLRDGQMRGRIALALKVENAAVRSTRIRLPELDAEDARSARATGEAVADLLPVAGQPGIWELRFQRGVLGEIPIEIRFQRKLEAGIPQLELPMATLPDARQSASFLAVRASGRIELDAPAPGPGWHRADWPGVPVDLVDPTERGAPALCFRAVEPDAPLSVTLRRQEMAGVLKLRVQQARLVSILSPRGHALTRVELDVRAGEKSSLRLTLPDDGELLALTVEDRNTALAREGKSILFHVLPGSDPNQPVSVAFCYVSKGADARSLDLVGPALDVPIEDVTWDLVLPEGHRLVRHSGGLVLREAAGSASGVFGLDEYLGSITAKKESQSARGSRDLAEGNRWLAEGDGEKARLFFSQAAANGALDAPSNEDARVQLRNLENQKAVVALNTMRQRMFLDNAGAVGPAGNEQVERAARQNPLLQGRGDYDPRQIEQLLEGNTFEETSALKRLAEKIVSQQASATPTLRSLEIALPESGSRLTFTRGVQVDGSQPLALRLTLDHGPARSAYFFLLLLLAIPAGLAALARTATRKP